MAIAQTPQKKVAAIRTSLPITLDGILNEEAWKKASLISDFVEQRPNFGRAENPANKSEVYLLYDDEAVYFGGILHERTKDSIAVKSSKKKKLVTYEGER